MIPQKLLFLVTHPSAGGVQEIWVNLAEAFHARGHDVRLMALYPLSDRETRETPPHLPWQYLGDSRPRIGIGLLLKLARDLRRTKPDMVFTAMPFVNVLTPVAARLAGVDTQIVTSHHSPVSTHGAWLNRLDGWTGGMGNVRAIVSVSNGVKDSLATKPVAYRAKCVTIRNALPPRIEALLGDLAPRGDRMRSSTRTVIATGRLNRQKNYETLLRAARHMPDVRVEIIGTGPDEADLAMLARELGVTGNVFFLGHRPREEALALLARGDLFVQPSLFEGHSLALIEAAKLKLPLVVSSADTQIEGVTTRSGARCGIIVDTLDDRALADKIRHLLDDPEAYAQWSRKSGELGASISYPKLIEAYAAYLPVR